MKRELKLSHFKTV